MNAPDRMLKFKTNINCDGCVAKVSPLLNEADGVCAWEVDTTTKDKILSVHSNGITQQEVIKTIQDAGFRIEALVQE